MERDFEALRAELEKKRQELLDLQQHPGYIAVLEDQKAQLVSKRAEHFNSAVNSMDSAFEAARRQGMITGMQQMIATIENRLQSVEGDLANLYVEMNYGQPE